MSKKVTAVEWLLQEWQILESQIPPRIINQAKAMEKQQIADAYDYEADADMHDYSSGEQYYDQTFL